MRILLFIFILLNVSSGIAQEQDTLHINDVYYDVKSNLLVERVFQYDTLRKDIILNKFANTFGYNIRNYELYKTSETESKITLHYVRNLYRYDDNVMDMYIIIVADFKDGKMRIRVYDDGNVYKPSIYSGNSKVVMGKEDRTLYLSSYFNGNDMIIYNTHHSFLNVRKQRVDLILEYINGINLMVDTIDKNITMYTTVRSDW